jgi:hypothetical protein
MGQTGAINANVRSTKARRSFLAINTTDPPHWTLNSCFGAFRTPWVHFGPFSFLMKLGSKRAELVQLMQEFVP